MRIAWISGVVASVGCVHQPISQPTTQFDGIPASWLAPSRGEGVKYPDPAWDAGIEGDVTVDLCLERGKVIRTENVSGHPELTAAVLKEAAHWEFIPVNVPRLTRVFRFKKSVSPADVYEREEGTILVTRGYEAPSIPDRELMQVLANDSGGSRGRARNQDPVNPSFTAGFHWCAGASGKLDFVELVFTNDEPAAKKLLDRFHKVQFKPAKLRGEPIPSCGTWWGTAVRMRSP